MQATPSTSEQIAAAALSLLEAEGANAVSMRRVARTVGITPMAIYHHFRSRRALLQSVVDRQFAQFQEAMRSAPKRGSHGSRLIHSVDEYVRFALVRPRIFDYVFSELRPGARRYPGDFRARRSPTLNELHAVIASAMKAGFLRRGDAWEVALDWWAHVHGFVALHRAGRFSLSPPAFLALVHRSLRRHIHGLRNR